MWFLAIGVAMLVMNLAGWGPVGEWTWGWGERGWFVLLPFGLAVVWWTWSDLSGRTRRKAMEKVEARREARRQKSLNALGIRQPGKRR